MVNLAFPIPSDAILIAYFTYPDSIKNSFI
jgi:hypothetical protein